MSTDARPVAQSSVTRRLRTHGWPHTSTGNRDNGISVLVGRPFSTRPWLDITVSGGHFATVTADLNDVQVVADAIREHLTAWGCVFVPSGHEGQYRSTVVLRVEGRRS